MGHAMPNTSTIMDSVDLLNAELDALEAHRPVYVKEIMNSPKKALAPAEKASKALEVSSYNQATLEKYFKRLFKMGDVNRDGVLQPEEVSALLKLTGFQFDDSTIAAIVRDADTNHDGVIEYEEFVPMMLKTLDRLA